MTRHDATFGLSSHSSGSFFRHGRRPKQRPAPARSGGAFKSQIFPRRAGAEAKRDLDGELILDEDLFGVPGYDEFCSTREANTHALIYFLQLVFCGFDWSLNTR